MEEGGEQREMGLLESAFCRRCVWFGKVEWKQRGGTCRAKGTV